MANVRDGMLRGRRDTIDTGSGEKRVNTRMPIRTGRGSFVNYYEDLGISTSPELAENIRKEEEEFQEKIKINKALAEKQRQTNASSASTLASTQSQLNKAKTEASFDYWARNNLATVQVSRPRWEVGRLVRDKSNPSGWRVEYTGQYQNSKPSIGRKVMSSLCSIEIV